jgi:16S rRNA (adenine1518-N6/adenine1519-N6)-dimethyltransferase
VEQCENYPSHRPRKRFGQHFLHAPGTIARIVEVIGPAPGQAMVEIGPGQGAITCPLLQRLGRLDVIELDRDLIPLLLARCGQHGELRVHLTDALTFDFAPLAVERGPLRLVGNLPYNISTPLLFHLLGYAGLLQDMHFMLQKEVVERMTAAPGGHDYGRLSIMLQYRCRAERLFTVGAGAFTPPPKVESAFVRLTPHPSPVVQVGDEAVFEQLVSRAFSQRRKTLRNALRGVASADQIGAADIDPRLRPEDLGLEHYARLSQVLSRAADSPRGAREGTD